ncbi:uncharacterized protein AB675_1662 [Cyphellophora attinorum]|uniref:Alpha-1,3-mannosyltransferase CMT1 n=1 Tax=Cyphellophora attinorum TaxID=1664694 RepID=A0A0N0NJ01_9EURO|nr:uncharacterized protein AB675_1662 [Phialophora attinorum]KPI36039.1 hypothetical protein AB675_1662 [Phialophora attinorum]
MLTRRRFRHSRQNRTLRYGLYVLAALLFIDILTILKHYRVFQQNLSAHIHTDRTTLPSPVRDQKIFICTQVWTNAEVVYYRWGDAIIDMVEALGPENVFLSIYESGSLDNTKEMLEFLERQLEQRFPTLRKEIRMENTTHEDEMNVGPYDGNGNPRPGWVLPPSETEKKQLRRIPFLAKLRNISLQPLLRERALGRTYDKILFVNDVVFTPSDVLTLLATNQGSYSTACALDFHSESRFGLAPYYDTFVLRDTKHQPHLSLQFPYFRPSDSLDAIWAGKPARTTTTLPRPIDDTALGLPFRGISDGLAAHHLEASECCLIHVDHATINPNHLPLYVNPAVRVAYSTKAYNLVHFGGGMITRTKHNGVRVSLAGPESQGFLSGVQYVLATWLHRLNRLRTSSAAAQQAKVVETARKWLGEEGTMAERAEKARELGKNGEMCLIDEMHLLIENGWRHA